MATPLGPHPDDPSDFGTAAVDALVEAALHLRWLADHGYAQRASTKLTGDRFQLTRRQRQALARGTCTSAAARDRLDRHHPPRGTVHVDGFNVLFPIERALGGGPVVRGQDGAFRDLGVPGRWRASTGTDRALDALTEALPDDVQLHWWLDAPVANSGRLATRLRERGWTADLVPTADPVLVEQSSLVATSDAGILDRGVHWTDLIGPTLRATLPDPWIVDLLEDP
jgi:hypothetical protein